MHLSSLLGAALIAGLLTTCGDASTGDVASALHLPPGFAVEKIASIDGPRELAVAPNGDLIVGTNGHDVVIVPDAEGDARAPQTFTTFDDAPAAGVALGDGALYVGTQFGVWRVPYRTGDRVARGRAERLGGVRTSGVSSDHVTTTVAVTGRTLFASVGSSCNVCDPELDPTRASIREMTLPSGALHARAVHVRNAIALAIDPLDGHLWAGVAGQDELAHGHPYEIFDDVSAQAGAVVDYGWPYCYEDRRAVSPAHDCAGVAVPRVVLPAYETPIGAVFDDPPAGAKHAFPARFRDGAFVALHGSWHRPLVAPRVVFVPFRGDDPARAPAWSDPTTQWQDFLTGFQSPDGDRVGRPTGVAIGTDGSLFVADDGANAVYRIRPRAAATE